MSDFIRKSELLEALEEFIEYDTFDHYKEEPLINMSFEKLEDIISNQPTLDEKEIIRKAFERVVERLENIEPTPWEIVKIVEEECGINE